METTGFTPHAPDSVYATRSPGWRASANRMEAHFNAQRRAHLARCEAAQGHPVSFMRDESLRRLSVVYRRQLEDIETGHLTGGDGRIRLINAQLRDIECEKEVRAALAESWQASEQGTHDYSAFKGRGGLLAVLEDHATPPSYDLASTLDWEHHLRDLPTVLDWEANAAD